MSSSSNDQTYSFHSSDSMSESEAESLVDSSLVGNDVEECSRCDYTEHFTTNMIWPTVEELREWVRGVGYGLFMVITTKASKEGKYIELHCERSGFYRPGKKKFEGEASQPKRGLKRGKKIGCPLMLHGKYVPGDFKTNPGWRLRVVVARHNHDIDQTLDGHTFAARLSEEQRRRISILSASGVKPKSIVIAMLKEFPGTRVTEDQVYSFKSMERIKSMGNLNITQFSLNFLKQRGYFTDTLSERYKDGKLVMTDLFISHPDARHLLRMFPNVVIMDSTYKTNMYGKPLLEFVGFTSANHTNCIALVFMKKESTKHYIWALKRLKWLFGNQRPLCIMSDRELGAIKGVENVFRDVRHLLCQVHVDRNVRAYAKLTGIDANKFCSSACRVMRSHTKEEYEERLQYFSDVGFKS